MGSRPSRYQCRRDNLSLCGLTTFGAPCVCVCVFFFFLETPWWVKTGQICCANGTCHRHKLCTVVPIFCHGLRPWRNVIFSCTNAVPMTPAPGGFQILYQLHMRVPGTHATLRGTGVTNRHQNNLDQSLRFNRQTSSRSIDLSNRFWKVLRSKYTTCRLIIFCSPRP